MTPSVADIEARVGKPFLPHQQEAVMDASFQAQQGPRVRLCLYHRTGAGKTYTALSCVRVAGFHEALVLAPPITHGAWIEWGRQVGVDVEPVSHAKFRQKGFKISRRTPLIVDEFHLLGGQTGAGWTKLDRLAPGLQAPLIIASATPNYNDAERCYCIMHVLDPDSFRGGFIQFLYRNCITEENPFGKVPNVVGFLHHKSAEDYLRQQERVHYVEDEAIKQVTIADIPMSQPVPPAFEVYGYDARRGRIMASQMEERHARKRYQLIGEDGLIRQRAWDELVELAGASSTPVLVYAESSTVATALHLTAVANGASALLITGSDTTKSKQLKVQQFIGGAADMLIGTASLATGTDGVDKMCDHLIIVDDTTDDSLRRQLIGRILPRGLDSDLSNKVVSRLVYL